MRAEEGGPAEDEVPCFGFQVSRDRRGVCDATEVVQTDVPGGGCLGVDGTANQQMHTVGTHEKVTGRLGSILQAGDYSGAVGLALVGHGNDRVAAVQDDATPAMTALTTATWL